MAQPPTPASPEQFQDPYQDQQPSEHSEEDVVMQDEPAKEGFRLELEDGEVITSDDIKSSWFGKVDTEESAMLLVHAAHLGKLFLMKLAVVENLMLLGDARYRLTSPGNTWVFVGPTGVPEFEDGIEWSACCEITYPYMLSRCCQSWTSVSQNPPFVKRHLEFTTMNTVYHIITYQYERDNVVPLLEVHKDEAMMKIWHQDLGGHMSVMKSFYGGEPTTSATISAVGVDWKTGEAAERKKRQEEYIREVKRPAFKIDLIRGLPDDVPERLVDVAPPEKNPRIFEDQSTRSRGGNGLRSSHKSKAKAVENWQSAYDQVLPHASVGPSSSKKAPALMTVFSMEGGDAEERQVTVRRDGNARANWEVGSTAMFGTEKGYKPMIPPAHQKDGSSAPRRESGGPFTRPQHPDPRSGDPDEYGQFPSDYYPPGHGPNPGSQGMMPAHEKRRRRNDDVSMMDDQDEITNNYQTYTSYNNSSKRQRLNPIDPLLQNDPSNDSMDLDQSDMRQAHLSGFDDYPSAQFDSTSRRGSIMHGQGYPQYYAQDDRRATEADYDSSFMSSSTKTRKGRGGRTRTVKPKVEENSEDDGIPTPPLPRTPTALEREALITNEEPDMEKIEGDMEAVDQDGNPVSVRPKKRHAKAQSPGHINRPDNVWVVFLKHYRIVRHEVKTAGLINSKQITKEASKIWQKMTDEERAPYHEICHAQKLYHKQKYPDYRYHPKRRDHNALEAEKIQRTVVPPLPEGMMGSAPRRHKNSSAHLEGMLESTRESVQPDIPISPTLRDLAKLAEQAMCSPMHPDQEQGQEVQDESMHLDPALQVPPEPVLPPRPITPSPPKPESPQPQAQPEPEPEPNVPTVLDIPQPKKRGPGRPRRSGRTASKQEKQAAQPPPPDTVMATHNGDASPAVATSVTISATPSQIQEPPQPEQLQKSQEPPPPQQQLYPPPPTGYVLVDPVANPSQNEIQSQEICVNCGSAPQRQGNLCLECYNTHNSMTRQSFFAPPSVPSGTSVGVLPEKPPTETSTGVAATQTPKQKRTYTRKSESGKGTGTTEPKKRGRKPKPKPDEQEGQEHTGSAGGSELKKEEKGEKVEAKKKGEGKKKKKKKQEEEEEFFYSEDEISFDGGKEGEGDEGEEVDEDKDELEEDVQIKTG